MAPSSGGISSLRFWIGINIVSEYLLSSLYKCRDMHIHTITAIVNIVKSIKIGVNDGG